MRNSYFWRALVVLAIGLLTALGATAQSPKLKSKFPPGPCHQRVKQCVANMQSQLNTVQAYVQRLKPGDKVSFNQQPDPPGNPDPWYLRAHTAFGLLQEGLYDLSKYPPSERKVSDINEAQEKLGRLQAATDGASARTALAAMKLSVRRLAQ